ncbi:MAG: GGDEF domain-containing protein [Clostridium sp.]|uniref:GGDEF domain-containing protein n=1 Tax=Clostridium sp. TaxID=1506 RepID=UPI002911C07B|nr:GGDEF domain-containing protein [Clostridium sp.]MDU7338026.1 GGDEF domain-containing protein [Clostridium sp.]
MNLIVQYLELNCYALIVLILVFRNVYRQDRQYYPDQRLFLTIICSVGVMIFLDTLMWLLDGRPGFSFRFLSILIMVIYNSLNPIICLIWYLYVDFYIYGSWPRIQKLLPYLIIPIAINFVLSFISIFGNIYFVFDEYNVYHRGKYVLLLLLICIFYVVLTSILLAGHRKRLNGKEFINLFLFGFFPAVGAFIQLIMPSGVLIWAFTTLSILLLYINIQNDQLRTDYLTGLFNRRYLDHHLSVKVKSRDKHLLAGMMIDLDSFKKINDVYGHDSGDQALRHVAKILRKTFRRRDFISRYGGDEFVIVLEILNPRELNDLLQRLYQNVDSFNEKKLVPYKISLTIGSECFAKNDQLTASSFLTKIDHLMYLNKQKRC